mmetsp:Transcript_4570/g.13184  ORF Transcript_4570/g.13184 Transcript_4570/m.13184 type:complete len:298 (+) Transcript_4570:279-1172(+)
MVIRRIRFCCCCCFRDFVSCSNRQFCCCCRFCFVVCRIFCFWLLRFAFLWFVGRSAFFFVVFKYGLRFHRSDYQILQLWMIQGLFFTIFVRDHRHVSRLLQCKHSIHPIHQYGNARSLHDMAHACIVPTMRFAVTQNKIRNEQHHAFVRILNEVLARVERAGICHHLTHFLQCLRFLHGLIHFDHRVLFAISSFLLAVLLVWFWDLLAQQQRGSRGRNQLFLQHLIQSLSVTFSLRLHHCCFHCIRSYLLSQFRAFLLDVIRRRHHGMQHQHPILTRWQHGQQSDVVGRKVIGWRGR